MQLGQSFVGFTSNVQRKKALDTLNTVISLKERNQGLVDEAAGQDVEREKQLIKRSRPIVSAIQDLGSSYLLYQGENDILKAKKEMTAAQEMMAKATTAMANIKDPYSMDNYYLNELIIYYEQQYNLCEAKIYLLLQQKKFLEARTPQKRMAAKSLLDHLTTDYNDKLDIFLRLTAPSTGALLLQAKPAPQTDDIEAAKDADGNDEGAPGDDDIQLRPPPPPPEDNILQPPPGGRKLPPDYVDPAELAAAKTRADRLQKEYWLSEIERLLKVSDDGRKGVLGVRRDLETQQKLIRNGTHSAAKVEKIILDAMKKIEGFDPEILALPEDEVREQIPDIPKTKIKIKPKTPPKPVITKPSVTTSQEDPTQSESDSDYNPKQPTSKKQVTKIKRDGTTGTGSVGVNSRRELVAADGKYGSIKLDIFALKNDGLIRVREGKKVILEEEIDAIGRKILTTRALAKTIAAAAPKTIAQINRLNKMAGLPPLGPSSAAKKPIKGAGTLVVAGDKEALVDRLHIATGEFAAGNRSAANKNLITELAAALHKEGAITKAELAAIYGKYK